MMRNNVAPIITTSDSAASSYHAYAHTPSQIFPALGWLCQDDDE